jgi:hypothetical protein
MNAEPAAPFAGSSIFYGPPNAVAQRAIVQFQQTLSGNGFVTFMDGSSSDTLTFGQVQTPGSGPLGTFALMTLTPAGGAALSVTLRTPTPSSLPADLVFSCSSTM